jgi:hypothetical protein
LIIALSDESDKSDKGEDKQNSPGRGEAKAIYEVFNKSVAQNSSRTSKENTQRVERMGIRKKKWKAAHEGEAANTKDSLGSRNAYEQRVILEKEVARW